jgi:Ca2+-transporting ATPase
VKAWQKRGDIVAMSGDGVNDAPALKQSDIGVAMGISGTEVSKDAANMILMDDNFSTIVKAVISGRNVYKNIKNAIKYLLSGNFAAILCVLITSLLLLPTPFLPVHLLFMNLITDSLPAIAIGMEKEHSDVLKEKPRQSNESILNKQSFMQILFEGILISLTTLLSYLYGYQYSAALASTMAFATLTAARLFHGFNCRSKHSIFKLGFAGNPASLGAFAAGMVFLNLVLFVPVLKRLFMVTALTSMQFAMIYVLAVIPTIIIQAVKVIREH